MRGIGWVWDCTVLEVLPVAVHEAVLKRTEQVRQKQSGSVGTPGIWGRPDREPYIVGENEWTTYVVDKQCPCLFFGSQ
jgi:hypothetical protein